jgi:HPt (histidine-containing phosphotransfer) domain-containing protein
MMVDLELDELKREFLAEADEKVREIQSNLEGERSPAGLERMTYLAHQLKGSGGSYGFEQISADGADLERALESLAKEASETVEQQVRATVTSLRAEVDKRIAELR